MIYNESAITMVSIDGLFMMGRFKDGVLYNPRVFNIIDASKVQISPLPGFPECVYVYNIKFSYEVKDVVILTLYDKVTKPATKMFN